MQKRSLLFLFILSISLLVTQFLFKPKVPEAQQKAQEKTVSTQTLESRVATQAGLPLVDLYKDPEGKTFLTSALLFDGKVLALKWDDTLPQEVYFKKSHTSLPTEQASLVTQDSTKTDPIVYVSHTNPGTLSAAELPHKGLCEVQLIQPKAYKNNPSIYSSFYSDGQLQSAPEIKGNAIAVASTLDGYEPVGVYVGDEGTLVPLKSFNNLKSDLSTHKAEYPNNNFNEKFYTLENEYQQLVFSNVGGAIAEINLPEKTDQNSKSLVLQTPQEKKLNDSGSKHAFFPAKSAVHAESKEGASQGGYYPLIRRSVDPTKSNPRYYAFNLVSDYPGLSQQTYQIKHHSKDKIVFELNQSYRKITKTFTLDPSLPYGFDVDIKIDGDHSNLWVTTGVPEAEVGTSQQPILKYSQIKNNKQDVSTQKLPKTMLENAQAKPDWISNSNGFFTILVDPKTNMDSGYKVNKVSHTDLSSRLEQAPIGSKKVPGYEFMLPLSSAEKETTLKVYAGPVEEKILKAASQTDSKKNSSYAGAQSFHGFMSFISEPCAKVLFTLMKTIFALTHSWGLSIILLTILVRLLLFPLNSWSIKALRKTQELQPEISEIQKKYKKNPKQGQMEIMALYKKRKVNPISGCLPMLIQMPFLIGMFNLLRSAFVLRGVPFVKGWIDNLTAPDVLFSWSHSIPFFGTEFHLLPIISGVMIWLQQKLSQVGPKDKSLMTDQQKQQKMMGTMMVLFMTVVCYNMPSGLNLYWISASLLAILQQWITNRLLDKKKNKPTILTKKKADLKQSKV